MDLGSLRLWPGWFSNQSSQEPPKAVAGLQPRPLRKLSLSTSSEPVACQQERDRPRTGFATISGLEGVMCTLQELSVAGVGLGL